MTTPTHPCPCGTLAHIEPDAPGDRPRILPHAPGCPATGHTLPLPLSLILAATTYAALRSALTLHRGDVTAAACDLGIHRVTADRMVRRYKLRGMTHGRGGQTPP